MQTALIRISTAVVESNQPSSTRSGSHKQSSHLLEVLEEAWSDLRDLIAGLPPAVLLVLSAREYRRRGHFAREAWRKRREEELLHEVAVHPGMFEAPDDLLITILHEAAHALLWESRKDGDQHCCGVSLSGYYHRREFRDAAVALGLKVHFLNRRYGFCVTTWPAAGVPDRYRAVLAALARFAVVATQQLPRHAAPAGVKRQVPWLLVRCACSPRRVLHCPPEEFQLGPSSAQSVASIF
jgi:hypothetical protein